VGVRDGRISLDGARGWPTEFAGNSRATIAHVRQRTHGPRPNAPRRAVGWASRRLASRSPYDEETKPPGPSRRLPWARKDWGLRLCAPAFVGRPRAAAPQVGANARVNESLLGTLRARATHHSAGVLRVSDRENRDGRRAFRPKAPKKKTATRVSSGWPLFVSITPKRRERGFTPGSLVADSDQLRPAVTRHETWGGA